MPRNRKIEEDDGADLPGRPAEHEEATSCETSDFAGNNNDYIIERLRPTEEESAEKAVATVLRGESNQIVANFVALTKNRMRLLEQLYANVERLNDAIFDPATFGMLSAKEKLFAMSIHLKAIAALSVTIEEHKDVVNQVNIQVNQLIKNDNKMLQIPKESREKIRAAVTKMVANVLNQSSDTAMLDDGAKTDDERLQ